jgi:hypothetical protein
MYALLPITERACDDLWMEGSEMSFFQIARAMLLVVPVGQLKEVV